MKPLLRWMRQVLPRDTIVAVAVGCDLIIELIYLLCLARLGFVNENAFASTRLMVQVFAAFLYGGHRVATFHPAGDAEYRQWLALTPWTPKHPLPMGPLHLVLQDLVVIAASMALTRIEDARVLYVPIVFLSTYAFCLACSVWATGQKVMAYLLGGGLGAVVLFVQVPASALMAAAATVALTPLAIRRSLAAFPWELPWYADGRSWQQMNDEHKQKQTGWPFDVFSPKPPRPWISLVDGVGLSLLIGWWYFAVFWQSEPAFRGVLIAVLAQTGLVGAIVRTAMYLANHRPPISFWGRITTLRPWQRGFDHIFLTPLAAAIAANTCAGLAAIALAPQLPRPMLHILPEWTAGVFTAGGLSLTLLILLLGGPALERWRLAGRHRVVFQLSNRTSGLGSNAKNQEFLQVG